MGKRTGAKTKENRENTLFSLKPSHTNKGKNENKGGNENKHGNKGGKTK